MYHSFRSLVFGFFLSFPLLLSGQGTGNSPFSQFGVGDLVNNNGNIRNMGMGYSGVSSGHHHYINFLNPALLSNLKNPKKSRPNHSYKSWNYFRNLKIDSTVKIDFNLNYQNKSIQASGGKYENTSGANLAYLTFALPISKTWGTAFGIVPYSTVNYNLNYSGSAIGNPTSVTSVENAGRGGIYKLFLSNGVGITSNLSLGMETSFLYGNINTQSSTNITNFTTKNYGFKHQANYQSFCFKPGLLFRREIVKVYCDTLYKNDSTGKMTIPVLIRKTKSSGMFYNIGFTYEFFSTLNINRSLDMYVMDAYNHISYDTTIETTKYKVKLPSTLRLGFSIDAPLRWAISTDIFYSPWANYKTGFSTDTMGNSYGFNLGGEYSLGIMKPRSKTLRAGFTYLKTPVVYKGHQLDDVSFSLGGSMPLGKKKRDQGELMMMPVRPKLSFALIFGQRGNITSFGIMEQYLKVYASLTIHHKWFDKTKIY